LNKQALMLDKKRVKLSIIKRQLVCKAQEYIPQHQRSKIYSKKKKL